MKYKHKEIYNNINKKQLSNNYKINIDSKTINIFVIAENTYKINTKKII